MSSSRRRDIVVKAIQAFGKQVKGIVLDLSHHLPFSMFWETGKELSETQSIARTISCSMYVRIVDKAPAQMWGFCQAWIWETTLEFLLDKGYKQDTITP